MNIDCIGVNLTKLRTVTMPRVLGKASCCATFQRFIQDAQTSAVFMSITPNEVMKIAHLARMSVEHDDVERYAQDLSGILNLVEHMNQVDVRGIEPMAHPLDMCQRLRADVVTEINQRDTLQAHAPAVEKGLFLVPKVIE